MGPFDWPAADFLALFAAVVAGGALLALLARWALRSPGGAPAEVPALHPYEVARLAGGPTRAMHAAVARMLQAGQLTLGKSTGKLFREAEPPADAHPFEKRLYEVAQGRLSVYNVTDSLGTETSALARRLQELGLELNEVQAGRARWAPVGVLAAVALFGLLKMAVDAGRGQAFDQVLLLACAVPVGLAVWAWFFQPHRSRRGDRLLQQLREQHAALEAHAGRQPDELPTADLLLAVGLFGVAVLDTGPLASLRRAVQSPPSTTQEDTVLPPPPDEPL
jgi:uncharacterized protein (TIGR04222 family)